jgi:hypothetical protein
VCGNGRYIDTPLVASVLDNKEFRWGALTSLSPPSGLTDGRPSSLTAPVPCRARVCRDEVISRTPMRR